MEIKLLFLKKSNCLVLILLLFGVGNLHAQVTAIPDATFERWLISHDIDTDGIINHQVAGLYLVKLSSNGLEKQ